MAVEDIRIPGAAVGLACLFFVVSVTGDAFTFCTTMVKILIPLALRVVGAGLVAEKSFTCEDFIFIVTP